MIHWLWLIPAVLVGAVFGMTAAVMCVVASDPSDD